MHQRRGPASPPRSGLRAFVLGMVGLSMLGVPPATEGQPMKAAAYAVGPSTSEAVEDGSPDLDLWLERMDELERWMADYRAWRDWSDRWSGKREPGWFTGSRERRSKPDPPSWLATVCADLVHARDTLREGCAMLADWGHDDPFTPRPSATAPVVDEQSAKTKWWEFVHVDALWPVTASGVSALGVAGIHASIAVTGRFHVFVAPGLMFVNLSASGERQWMPATHWGIGYELADFRLPGASRPAALHVNIARAWLLGGRPEPLASALTIAGFSITFKRAP